MIKKLHRNSAYSSKSIVRDLILWLVLLVFLIGGIAELAYYIYSERLVEEELNKQADTLIEELSSMLSIPLYNIDLQSVHHIGRIYTQLPSLQGIRIDDEQNNILFDSTEQKTTHFFREMDVRQDDLYLGHVTLMLADYHSPHNRKQTLITIFFMGLALICAMVAGINIIMHYILIKPLLRFNRGLSEIAEGNYSIRLEPVKHKDLNSSVEAVNSLADHIERVVGEFSLTRDFLQNVLDSMPSIIIGVDHDSCITNMNRTAIRTSMKTGKECLGKPITDVFPALEGEGIAIIKRSIAERLPITIEKKNSPVLGREKSSEVTVYPLYGKGLDGAVIRIDDITARVRLQEVMVQTEKMISVGGLGAGMAHEINNPLSGILQAAQNIERRLSPELEKNREVALQCGFELQALQTYLQDRQIYTMLTGIRESGQRAAQIVQNMLQFSRRNDSVMKSCVLAEILDRVIELARNDYDLKRKYDFKNFRIIRNYSSDIEVVCSWTEMEQVFINLLKNAAQAYGSFEVGESHRPEIAINAYQDEEYVTVKVVDNGPGIEEDVKKRIFEPFFTTKKVGEGTGLGLAVSFFIVVDQHNGRLSVESTPGQGATFIVQLPRK